MREHRGLEITFPFPDLSNLHQCKVGQHRLGWWSDGICADSQPTNYMTHFIGHEGKGSILSYLKKQGWSNYLRAGMSHGAAGFDFFKVTVDLTPDGLSEFASEQDRPS